jgi:hypothetical protein
MHRFIAVSSAGAIALALVALVWQITVQPAQGESLPVQRANSAGPVSTVDTIGRSTVMSSGLSCREGLIGWEPYLAAGGLDIQQLGGGHYIDFAAHVPRAQPEAMEYVQMIRMKQNKTMTEYLPGYQLNLPLSDTAGGLGPLIASAPSSLWLVGNEPDRGPDVPGGYAQDDIYPEEYAQAYHDVYHFIKERDPSAQVAVAGLVEVTPGRMQYLDIVWNTYLARYGVPMPVDVWNMHIYILPEVVGVANVALGTDPALAYTYIPTHTPGVTNAYTYGDHDKLAVFDSQVRRMRQWMKDHGQQDKPLLLSEFGILYDEEVTDEFGNNFTPARATVFLTKSFNYLATVSDANLGMPSDQNRLVQQWNWFSVNFPVGHVSNLITGSITNTASLTFTQVGWTFKTSVAGRPLTSNLQPRSTNGTAPLSTPENSRVTATLAVQVVNDGNRHALTPLTITFYANSALTEVIDSTIITTGIPGCARRLVTAKVTWPNLGVGMHPYWVKVDASNAVDESNEADNVIAGQMFVGTRQLFLPLVAKKLP